MKAYGFCVVAVTSAALAQAPATQPALEIPVERQSLFFDPEDGAFDVSGFLATRTGFLPIAMPITEPAVEGGLAAGLAFFHGKPHRKQSGERTRVIMPSITAVFGFGTFNESYGGGAAHLGSWNEGRIRYLGAAGAASINLEWFGKDDALQGRAIDFNADPFFLLQQITFQLGESDLQIGPRYQFLSMDASFEGSDDMISGISASEFKSATSGAGLTGVYDTRDHPFSPTRGMRLAGTGMVFDKALGSDFDYRLLQTSALGYVPLDDKLVLGLRLEANLTDGDVPFYGLQGISMRGIPMGRYLHDVAIVAETELRWDVTQRWSLVGFGGVGRVADSLEDIDDTEDRFSGGGGFRYLIARQYGLRLGLDVAHGPEDWAVYIGLGTGWIRE